MLSPWVMLWKVEIWIQDKNGQATALLETKSGQKLLRGTWVDMHDKRIAEICGLLPYISSIQTCS